MFADAAEGNLQDWLDERGILEPAGLAGQGAMEGIADRLIRSSVLSGLLDVLVTLQSICHTHGPSDVADAVQYAVENCTTSNKLDDDDDVPKRFEHLLQIVKSCGISRNNMPSYLMRLRKKLLLCDWAVSEQAVRHTVLAMFRGHMM